MIEKMLLPKEGDDSESNNFEFGEDGRWVWNVEDRYEGIKHVEDAYGCKVPVARR